jgi:ABC-2 type transport system ATP-binding protein
VILDEPTAGADPSTREHILQAVRDLAAGGTALVYTTHYLPEVERLDADVALLEHGRVIARGSIDELVARHAPPEPAVAGVQVVRPSLETVYLALTGRSTVEPDAVGAQS